MVLVVRMLLTMQVVEKNPGPAYIYRMSLLEEPKATSLPMTEFPLTVICSDGRLNGDFSILVSKSRMIRDLIGALHADCQSCKKYLNLPDVSMVTVAHLVELLITGKTDLKDEKERKRVMQLQWSLGCNVITRFQRIKPDLVSGQCLHCLR